MAKSPLATTLGYIGTRAQLGFYKLEQGVDIDVARWLWALLHSLSDILCICLFRIYSQNNWLNLAKLLIMWKAEGRPYPYSFRVHMDTE